jgi:uncharacterized membrane protein
MPCTPTKHIKRYFTLIPLTGAAMDQQSVIRTALMGLVALGVAGATTAQAQSTPKEKCYGVSKAGQNECAAGKHSCAGTAKQDNDPEYWKLVAKGSCEKMGGKLAPPKI